MRIHDTGEPIERQTRNDAGTRRVETTWKEQRHSDYLSRQQSKPFIAWDGEGYTTPDGTHHYSLFGNSQGGAVRGTSLDWEDCLPLLCNSPADAYHVIFAGNYDVVMMFRHHPAVRQILAGESTKVGPYRVLYRRAKYLQVYDTRRKGSTRILYDVWTFFRVSFVEACREYGIGDSAVLDEVERMKSQRNDFTHITDEIRMYMASELSLLVSLCDNLRDRLALANIYPGQWHGPGAIASAVLRSHNIGNAKGSYSGEFRIAAEAAYYGGRFEQFRRGSHHDTVYQYDIRSAYPAAMTHLPDLSAVEWTYQTEASEHSDYALYKVAVSHINDYGIGTIPHRDRFGTIHFPSFAYGWYWGVECSHIPLRYRRECWWPTGPGLEQRPFRFVSEAYKQRAILKKAKQPQQLAIKLMLNSLYGKLAQSKGAKRDKHGRWQYPAFHEIVWAGWITAFTRSRLSDAMHMVPTEHIIACETDSVFSTVPIDLDVGDGLGQWELATADGIRYIQSGVNLLLQDGEWRFKTRGFSVPKQSRDAALWERFLASNESRLQIRQTRFGTDARIVGQFGRWYTVERNLSLEPSGMDKRVHVPNGCPACEDGQTLLDCLHPMVRAVIFKQASLPYRFAWREKPGSSLQLALPGFEDDPIGSMEMELVEQEEDTL